MIDILALSLKALQDAQVNAVIKLAESTERPVVRLIKIGTLSPSSQMPAHLYEFDIQADFWGNTEAEVADLIGDVETVLRSHPTNQHGQITRFQMVNADDQPDETWPVNGQPGPRTLSILRLHAHP